MLSAEMVGDWNHCAHREDSSGIPLYLLTV